MRFDILTLFPQMFAPFLENGVIRRAFASGQVEVHLWNPRDFAEGNYRRVDDRPFGGGPGMVMLADPLQRCLDAAQQSRTQALPEEEAVPVVLFSPIGHTLHHGAVAQWAQGSGAILLCGRYEGIDQRFIDANVTHQISLGDFVLSGGEMAALVLLDAITRLQPGVLTTPAPKCGKATACLRRCCRATMPTLSAGGVSKACASPPSSARNCCNKPAAKGV